MCASSGALRLSWSQPMRILTVTGTETALTVASISARGERQVAHQRAAGVAVDDLLDRAAHVDVDDRRAAILVELGRLGHLGGLQPASCIETGSSIGSHAAFCRLWRVSRIIAGLAIISVTLSPEP